MEGGGGANRLYYLSIAPRLFGTALKNLVASGLAEGRRRLASAMVRPTQGTVPWFLTKDATSLLRTTGA